MEAQPGIDLTQQSVHNVKLVLLSATPRAVYILLRAAQEGRRVDDAATFSMMVPVPWCVGSELAFLFTREISISIGFT